MPEWMSTPVCYNCWNSPYVSATLSGPWILWGSLVMCSTVYMFSFHYSDAVVKRVVAQVTALIALIWIVDLTP